MVTYGVTSLGIGASVLVSSLAAAAAAAAAVAAVARTATAAQETSLLLLLLTLVLGPVLTCTIAMQVRGGVVRSNRVDISSRALLLFLFLSF